MTQNELLYSLRIERNLNLHQASKLVNINWLILKNMEEGYLRLNEKRINKICIGYNIPLDSFSNCSNLVCQINLETKKENKFISKIKKIFFSWTFYIINLILLIGSIIAMPLLQNENVKVTQNPIDYYSEPYKELYSLIKTEGEDTSLPLLYLFYTNEGMSLTIGNDETDYSSYVVAKPSAFPFLFYIEDKLENETYNYSLTYDATMYDEIYNIELTFIDNEEQYEAIGSYDLSSFTISSISTGSSLLESTNLDKNSEQYKEKEALALTICSYSLNRLNFSYSTNISTNYTLNEVLSSIALGNNWTASYKDEIFTLSLIFSIILATSAIFFLALTFLKIKIRIYVNNDENQETDDSYTPFIKSECKSLPKNFSFSPFLKDGYLRIIGVILLSLSSIALGMRFLSIYSNDPTSKLFQFFNQNYKSLKQITPVAYLLIIFLKIYTMTKKQNIMNNVIIMFYLGIIFYLFEIFTNYYIGGDGSLIGYITEFLPTNLFWSIELFVLTAAFLFTTPKFINKKYKLILFRLISLIPTIYLIICYSLSVLSTEGIINIPIYLKYLMIDKNIVVALFGILFIYSSYFLQLYLKYKYGNEFRKVENSNQVEFIKNFIACLIITILAILDNVLQDNSFATTLGFGKNLYIYCLIPAILFYKERLPKQNAIQNSLFTISSSIANSISYIIIICLILIEG